MTWRAATLLALVLGLLLVALAARRAEIAWMAAPLLTTLAWGLVRAPAREAVRLEASRRVRREPGGAIEVSATVRHAGASPLHLQLADAELGPLSLEKGEAAGRWLLLPGEEAELRYSVRVARGRLAWRALHVSASDPLGLFEEKLRVDTPAELHVLPDVARLRPLPLRPDRTLPSPGSIPARVGGSGTEFHGVREYQVGDPLRWLDWRLMARHPGTVFTREFEQEQIADVGLVLDGTGIPDDGAGEKALFEHGVRAAASLASTFLRQGNRVSLLVLGETEARVYPGAGRIQLRRILTCLAEARPAADGPARSGSPSISRLFPPGATVFVLTALTAPGPSLPLRLRSGRRQVVVVSPDPLDPDAPALPREPLGRLALRAARVERQLGLRAIAQLRITVVDWPVRRPLYPLLRNALRPARGGQRS